VSVRRDEEKPFHWLHVERVETHSVDTLDARNQELDQIAREFGVKYDGMDVGAVPE
jgi:hypothetical protein